MSMSVGIGRIIPDPQASARTRQALAILSDPYRVVNNRGITIDDEGRVVAQLNPSGGITEDDDGLAIKLQDDGALEVSEDGLAVKVDPSGVAESGPDGLFVELPWTRFLSGTTQITVLTGAAYQDYSLTVTGAQVGDCVIVSPMETPTNEIIAWSGYVSAANTVVIRQSTGVVGPGTNTLVLRVTVIGVT